MWGHDVMTAFIDELEKLGFAPPTAAAIKAVVDTGKEVAPVVKQVPVKNTVVTTTPSAKSTFKAPKSTTPTPAHSFSADRPK